MASIRHRRARMLEHGDLLAKGDRRIVVVRLQMLPLRLRVGMLSCGNHTGTVQFKVRCGAIIIVVLITLYRWGQTAGL